MIKVNIKIDIDQIVEIGECHIEVELSTDRIIEEGPNMITIIEVTLGQEILEIDIEVTIKIKILKR